MNQGGRIEQQLRRGYRVQTASYISQGWQLFTTNAGEFVGFTILSAMVMLMVNGVFSHLPVVGVLPGMALEGPLLAGFLIISFKLIRNQTPTFSDFFLGFRNFLPLALASLAIGGLVTIGMFLLILPGVYLAVAYGLTLPLMVDREMDFWPAMESSRKLVTKEWFGFLGFLLALLLINLLGLFVLFIGVFVSVPVSMCALAVAYTNIVGLKRKSE